VLNHIQPIGQFFVADRPLMDLTAVRADITLHHVYKSAFDLSDMSDAMDDQTAGSMVPRCVADLKPGVCDAPLHGFGA
jgi:hypothetical protein